jgi:hypothetical protein
MSRRADVRLEQSLHHRRTRAADAALRVLDAFDFCLASHVN